MSVRPALRERRAGDERGTVLPLVALSMVALIGFAAFAIDVGWLLLNGSRAQRAADASALAAVTAMPADTTTWETSTAYQTAVAMGATNGYEPAEVFPAEVFGSDGTKLPNRIRVEVRRDVPTFFMRVFGIDSVSVGRTATAEFIPPLQLGSDEPQLGNFPREGPVCGPAGLPVGCIDPANPDTWGGHQVGFWVAINAEYTAKEQGDPVMTRCLASNSISSCLSGNNEFSANGYYYAIEVKEGAGSLDVDLFDARFWGGVTTSEVAAGDVMWLFNGGPATTFRLYAPDGTPYNPSDNSELLCSQTFSSASTGFLPGPNTNFAKTDFCNPPTRPGIYVLQVTAASGHAVNGFSVRASTSGPAPAVYGIGRMSIKANQAGSNPVFKLVNVTPVYAGRSITVSLFDPGEAAGNAFVFFEGRAASLPCEIVVRRENGSQQGPFSPGGVPWGGSTPPGAPACWVKTAPPASSHATGDIFAEYNNDWIDFTFDVPADYDCSVPAGTCWWTVHYVFSSGEVHDRTTWRATVQGQPIRLVLDQTGP